MAVEVSKMFLSNYGIGITGYAAIVPECEEEGLFAYFSLAKEQQIVLAKRLTSTEKHPYEVQVNYTRQVIQLVHDYLKFTFEFPTGISSTSSTQTSSPFESFPKYKPIL